MFDFLFAKLNLFISQILFFDITFWEDQVHIPFTVIWLIAGAVYFTFRLKGVSVYAFRHAVAVTLGRYKDEDSEGEVSHFAALSTALAATLGLGNIAGVAVAVSIGGPGATFWMIVAGLLGMASKFAECTLGVMYRAKPRGAKHLIGGPMVYLKEGLTELGWPRLGAWLSVIFSWLCIGGAYGGGTSFQVSQSLNAIQETVPYFREYPWVYGLTLVVLTGIVLLGGIKRLARVTESLIPAVCGIYIVACLFILFRHLSEIPEALLLIWNSAFTREATFGGFWGVMIMGLQRASFSNEAGIGSASIAHSTAKTKYPAREGVVALLEPFIDTVVVCTMTALVLVITKTYNHPDYQLLIESKQGAALTSKAFGQEISWFPYVLSLSVFLFAYATIISWSYYGERCFAYMFSEQKIWIYQVGVLVVVFLGSIAKTTHIMEFGDLMILGMSLPNLIGLYMLTPKIVDSLNSYWAMVKNK